jgi:hypothetical protein
MPSIPQSSGAPDAFPRTFYPKIVVLDPHRPSPLPHGNRIMAWGLTSLVSWAMGPCSHAPFPMGIEDKLAHAYRAGSLIRGG